MIAELGFEGRQVCVHDAFGRFHEKMMQTAMTQTRADYQASHDTLPSLLRAHVNLTCLDMWVSVAFRIELGHCRYEHCVATPPKHASAVLQVMVFTTLGVCLICVE